MSTSSDPTSPAAFFSGRTAWARSVETPLREFLRTETGGAAVLLAAAVAALVWVNVDASSYDSLWSTKLSIDVADAGVSLDLRQWVNSGLMTFFFFVVGLEARREIDLGELRERRRVALPLLAGIGGMVGAIGIYLAFNAGRPSAHGWGIAMSTDTAFALGLLALVGPRFPDRLRAFILTVVVVDDIVALLVIATVYTETLRFVPLLVAFGFFAVVLVLRSVPVRVGLVYFVLGAGAWVGLLKSGVEPIVVGLVMGLLVYARPPPRSTLERATERFREFREQPTADLARVAGVEIVINLQGDFPTIEPGYLHGVLKPLADPAVDIATLAAEIHTEEEATNPNVVKVIGSSIDPGRLRALYFTRATAPWGEGPRYHHIGLYAYRRSALERFVALPPSVLEQREKLEQLRAIEAGMRIDVTVVDTVPRGVDTPADLETARQILTRG